jgi:hypothetical protein
VCVEALPILLAPDGDGALFEVKFSPAQLAGLRDAEPVPVEHLHHEPIALRVAPALARRSDYPLGLGGRQVQPLSRLAEGRSRYFAQNFA